MKRSVYYISQLHEAPINSTPLAADSSLQMLATWNSCTCVLPLPQLLHAITCKQMLPKSCTINLMCIAIS